MKRSSFATEACSMRFLPTLPGMLDRVEGSRKLRIWSAASSSGQEAYSIAMLLRELGKGPEHAEILGTDLSTQVIHRAREGRYTRAEMQRGLPSNYRDRYFVHEGTEWRLCEEVRSLVRFEQMDLRRNVGRLGRFDLILLSQCIDLLRYGYAKADPRLTPRNDVSRCQVGSWLC